MYTCGKVQAYHIGGFMTLLRSLIFSFLCIAGIASAATPYLQNDLQLAPFDALVHGEQARKIYEGAFQCPGYHPHTLDGNFYNQEKVFVLTQGTTVIGVIIYRDCYEKGQTIRYVERLAVDPALHSHGYGSILIKKFELKALQEGVARVELHALTRAIPFYQRNGFIKNGYNYMIKQLDIIDITNTGIQMA